MIGVMTNLFHTMQIKTFSRAFALAVTLMTVAATAVHAQSSATGVPNAMQGFSQNRDKPIQIEAASLEMRDKDKAATFTGNVKVVQGDTTMLCKSLVVFYDNDPAPGAKKPAMKSATPGPTGSSSIKRLEAEGGVTVTQKDQTVTGRRGVFDMRANTVTMIGNVLLTKEKNVLQGDRLVVDLTTGVSRVESDKGPVKGIFQTTPGPNGGSGGTSLLPQPGAAAKNAPGKPLKLNDLTDSRRRNG